MTIYNPHCWVILKLQNSTETTYKVLAGWYGGYMNGDSWKINSGITKMKKENDYYSFEGYSGSTYNCHKNAEKMSGMTASIYSSLKDQETDELKINIITIEDFEREFK